MSTLAYYQTVARSREIARAAGRPERRMRREHELSRWPRVRRRR
jgi:hypothetical protein